MKIKIDKKNGVPIYHQLIEQLSACIETGTLKKGDKLPPERDLSEELDISRGTVKKAYDELSRRGMLESVQGKGTFVYFGHVEDIKKSYARNSIDQNIILLEKMGFTHGEIKSMYDIIISGKMNNPSRTKIASIDCNPEALEIFQRQVSEACNIWMFPFLLNEVLEFANPDEVFENFDLIITTTTHYKMLKAKLGSVGEKFAMTAVSPDRETIVGLAGIPEGAKVGILSKSARFSQIINNNLEPLNKNFELSYLIVEPHTSEKTFKELLDSNEYIISPPFYTLNLSNSFNNHTLNFHSRGGRIIIFNYVIERGSLIYIMENV